MIAYQPGNYILYCKMKKGLILLTIIGVIAACGSPKKEKEQGAVLKMVVTDQHPGHLEYKKHCMACHQRDARGIPGMYPPLADNKVVSGEKVPLINIMLNGLSGEIEVNGETYNGVMASYRNLSDKELADILNYIRSGFGNSGEEITAEEVKALR